MSTKREVVEPPAEQGIGPELKRIREAAGLSVRTLAERAGFSASFISQVENGQVSPSIASLGKIAATLDVTLADFFAASTGPAIAIVRANGRPNFRSSWSRARIEALTPVSTPRTLEGIMVTLDAEGSSGREPSGVANEQVAVIFAGEVALTMSGETVDLEHGDAVLIPAGTPHRWHNPNRRAAQILLVSRRSGR